MATSAYNAALGAVFFWAPGVIAELLSPLGQSLPKLAARDTSVMPLIATEGRTCREVRKVPILLRKSKIEQP
jgi:hypothetical protein